MIKVAVAGLGFMGQTHFNCYRNNPNTKIVAVGDRNPGKLVSGSKVTANIGANQALDLKGVRKTTEIESLIDDAEVDLLDITLPTRQHARFIIAALEAGKHVLCEKPFAWTLEECDAVIAAQQQSGKALLIGHCLRFWPQYVKAHELIQNHDLGEILYARFSRVSGAPNWSRWLMDGSQSGGAVLDMHVHDIDTTLWWFGKPDSLRATGVIRDGLPIKVDAAWNYDDGPQVHLHGGWDLNGGDFAMGFELTGTRASLRWDSSQGEAMQLFENGSSREIVVESTLAYQAEIDYFIECIIDGVLPSRVTPQSSRASIEIAREELRQMGFAH